MLLGERRGGDPIASLAAGLKMRIQKALAEGDDGTAELLLDELVGQRERSAAPR